MTMSSHQSARSVTDVWLTPPEWIEALGGASKFDLDPCAAPTAPQPWPTARRHYREQDTDVEDLRIAGPVLVRRTTDVSGAEMGGFVHGSGSPLVPTFVNQAVVAPAIRSAVAPAIVVRVGTGAWISGPPYRAYTTQTVRAVFPRVDTCRTRQAQSGANQL
jgi:hypothetical protein